MLIPQCLAYAELAGLDAYFGLYERASPLKFNVKMTIKIKILRKILLIGLISRSFYLYNSWYIKTMRNWTNSNFFSTHGWFHNAAIWLANWSKIPWNIKSISCHYVGCYYGNYFGEFGITATRIFGEFYFIVCKNSNTGRSGTRPLSTLAIIVIQIGCSWLHSSSSFHYSIGTTEKDFRGSCWWTNFFYEGWYSKLYFKLTISQTIRKHF